MKKLFLSACLLVFATAAFSQAQWGYGVRAGMNLSEIIATLNKDITTVWRVGFTAGVFGDVRFNENFALEADVLYSQQGVHKFRARHAGSDAPGFKTNMNYINIPLLAKFYLTKGFNVVIGPQGSFLVKKKVEGDLDADAYNYVKNSMNRANIDLLLGLGYEFQNGLMLDLRYHVGLTQPFEKTDNIRLTNGHNSVIQLTAAWRF